MIILLTVFQLEAIFKLKNIFYTKLSIDVRFNNYIIRCVYYVWL